MNAKRENRDLYSLDQNDFYIRKTSNKFLVNSVFSVLFLYIASLIDTLFVGYFIGEDGLAAMSLVGPVYLIYYTIGATIGIGASIHGSRALGQGDPVEYRKTFTSAVILLGLAAVVMTVLGYCFTGQFMKLLCGSVTGPVADMAREYFLYYIPGGVCTLVAYIPLYFLKTEGKPKAASRLFMLSGVINVIFSWLFMSPLFHMGIAGASLATSLSFFAVAVVGYFLLLKGKTELRFVRGSFSRERLKQTVASGIPIGLSDLLESGRILLVNMLIIGLGASPMLTCYTVVRNVSGVLNVVVIGIATSIIPMIGVFYGETNFKDVRIAMKRLMRIGVITLAVLTALVCIFAVPICLLFGVTDPEVIAEAKWAIPLANVFFVFGYANHYYVGYLTTVKRTGLAVLIAALRLFVMVAAFAVPLSAAVGIRGIWLSLSLTEISTFGIFCLIRTLMRKKEPMLDKYLLDTGREQPGDISFAVKNDAGEIVNASEKITAFCKDNGIGGSVSMRVSHAIEEILVFLLKHCLGEEKENYVAVRVCKTGDDVVLRFRYMGEVYDPLDYYQNNRPKDEKYEELLGLQMIMKTAKKTEYRLTLGLNNITLVF